jgi:prolyl 4-hydroxylase
MQPSIVYNIAPYIAQYDNWLTDAEIDFILSQGTNFVPARVLKRDGSLQVDPVRQCERQQIDYGSDRYFDGLTKRIADFFRVPSLLCVEPLLIMKYKPGNYFDWHTDLTGGFATQRIATMLIYLNDDFEGGLTGFQTPNLKVQPKRGSALVFYYNPKEPMIHQGAAVTSGTKFILTALIRNGEFSLADRQSVRY